MQAPTTRIFTPARIVALVPHRALACSGSATCASRPAAEPVSVPAGRACRPADHCKPATTHRARQLRRRLRHAGRAREPRRSALAADRVAGHPHPRARGAPGRADLPARGRPRAHEHGLPGREPLRRQPRRRARRLPRRRRLVRARLPRGGVGAEALRRLPRPRSPSRAYGERLPGVRRPPARGRRRPRRLLAARAGRRPRGGPARARLRARRPAQRERRHAHRA